MVMKKNICNTIKSGFIMMFAAIAVTACSDYNPLDSYSRIPPDRTQSGNTDEGAGGLFESGLGTQDSPYVIMNVTQLRNMSQVLLPENTVYFKLGADIDMKKSNWTPLNNADGFVYLIDFDGAGHVIKNFSSKGHSYSSFFGVLNGACRNVGFVDASIVAKNASGVICGYLGDNSGKSGHSGIIENCYASGEIENTGTPSGGLVGRDGTSDKDVITNCYSAVNVSSSNDSGGVIGHMYSVDVTNCYSAGVVNAGKGSAGGVVAFFNTEYHNSCTFKNVIGWNKSISGAGQGKVIGFVGADCIFETSYAWNGIDNINQSLSGWSANRYHGNEIKTSEELLPIVQAWGTPWSSTASHNGFPLLEWLASRADYAEVCGLSKHTDPDPEPEPEEPTGEGTQENPYILTTAGHIEKMGSLMIDGQTVYFKLGQNIDMTNVQNWTPLNTAAPFNKAIDFDGDGFTISNFKCNYNDTPSFFGVVNGCVRNVAFTDAVITGERSGAAIIGGYVGTGGIVGKVENVYVHGEITVHQTAPAGGIAGNLREKGSYIKNCHANVKIISDNVLDGTDGTVNAGIGGVAGRIFSNTVIENCLTEGEIDATKAFNKGDNAGGIYGRINSKDELKNSIIIKNCIAWQTRIDGRAAAGRIGGRDFDILESENCYARKDMELCQDGNKIELSGAYAQAEQGADCENIISTAQTTLGWSSEIWDFSGDTPRLKCIKE